MTRNINRLCDEDEGRKVSVIKDAVIAGAGNAPLFFYAFADGRLEAKVICGAGYVFFFIVALIADYVRCITKPQTIITGGGAWSVLKSKIYWAIGPQFEAIGMIYGFVLVLLLLFSATKETPETITLNAPQQQSETTQPGAR